MYRCGSTCWLRTWSSACRCSYWLASARTSGTILTRATRSATSSRTSSRSSTASGSASDHSCSKVYYYPVADLEGAEPAPPPPRTDRSTVKHALQFRILKMIATSGFLTALECTKFVFGWGCAPDLAGGAYSAPQTPCWFKEDPTSVLRKTGGVGWEERGRPLP